MPIVIAKSKLIRLSKENKTANRNRKHTEYQHNLPAIFPVSVSAHLRRIRTSDIAPEEAFLGAVETESFRGDRETAEMRGGRSKSRLLSFEKESIKSSGNSAPPCRAYESSPAT